MRTLRIFLCCLGLALIAINIVGLFKSLRNPGIYTEKNSGRLNDITIKLGEVKEEIIRKTGESDKEFALRINDVVSKSMSHYWNMADSKKYNMRVPSLGKLYFVFCKFLQKG